MKEKNKGFTLVELLAVIVILALIALIATPIILNVIKNLEKSIRTINITSFRLEQNTGDMSLTVNAQAFYLAQANVALREKVIKSDDTSKSDTSTAASSGQEDTTGDK